MKEYKRQRKDFEEQLRESQEKARYHDDHLRSIDAFFEQTVDEVRLMVAGALPTPPTSASPSGMRPPICVM